MEELAKQVEIPADHIQRMVPNDLYRLEQKLANVLYLLKRNKTYSQHKAELEADPTNH